MPTPIQRIDARDIDPYVDFVEKHQGSVTNRLSDMLASPYKDGVYNVAGDTNRVPVISNGHSIDMSILWNQE